MGRRRVRRALAWITAAWVASWLVSNAQAAGLATALPPQSLADALDVFSRATGYQVIYRADLTAGVSTPGADAGLSVIDTLRQLLRGTGLGFKFINDRTIAIVRLPASEPSHPTPPDRSIHPVERSPPTSDAGAPTSAATGTTGDKEVRHRSFWGRIAGIFTVCGSLAAAGGRVCPGRGGARCVRLGYSTPGGDRHSAPPQRVVAIRTAQHRGAFQRCPDPDGRKPDQ